MVALRSSVLGGGVAGVVAPETTRCEIDIARFFTILRIESCQGTHVEGANAVDTPWMFFVLETTIGCGGE
jgi:hypothetical protein